MQPLPQWWNEPLNILRLLAWVARQEGSSIIADGRHFDAPSIIKNPERATSAWNAYLKAEADAVTLNSGEAYEFFDDRFYPIDLSIDPAKPNRKNMPSVSTVLWAWPNHYLTQWIGEMGNQMAEAIKVRAGEIGSRVHDALTNNQIINRRSFSDDEWLLLMRAHEWISQYRPVTVLNESVVWSTDPTLEVAGRLDRIVRLPADLDHPAAGKLVLVDFKTGKTIGRKEWLQLRTYRMLVEMSRGIKVDTHAIIHLNATTKAGWKFMLFEDQDRVKENGVEAELKRDEDSFRAVYHVWKDAFQNLRPKRFPMPPPETLDLSCLVDTTAVDPPVLSTDVKATKTDETQLALGGEAAAPSTSSTRRKRATSKE